MTRFEPGDTVSFTHGEHWIVGEVDEVRRGHQGDNLLVVRQGGPWSGSRYIVLSSYAQEVGKGSSDPFSPGDRQLGPFPLHPKLKGKL